MKALIIGGTRGFGKEISSQLSEKDYDLITIGRSEFGFKNFAHYSCDVGNLKNLKKILKEIKSRNKSLDVLGCVVGFTRAKSSAKLTSADWEETLRKNLIYVGIAFEELKDLLKNSSSPRVFTIGSQWSYKTGSDELVPYTVAKHALRALTKDFANREPKIKVNHYCVPTMNTPQYWEVRESFKKIKREKIIADFTSNKLAAPKVIAKSLVDRFLKTKSSGLTFVIELNGKVSELK